MKKKMLIISLKKCLALNYQSSLNAADGTYFTTQDDLKKRENKGILFGFELSATSRWMEGTETVSHEKI